MAANPVSDKPRPTPITARAVVIALLISLLFAYIVPYVDVYLQDTFLGAQHLPPGSVFMLLALTLGVNPLLRFIGRRAPFTRQELLYIYCLTLFSNRPLFRQPGEQVGAALPPVHPRLVRAHRLRGRPPVLRGPEARRGPPLEPLVRAHGRLGGFQPALVCAGDVPERALPAAVGRP